MLNAIWAVMILLAVLYDVFTGRMSDVTNAALDSAGEYTAAKIIANCKIPSLLHDFRKEGGPCFSVVGVQG